MDRFLERLDATDRAYFQRWVAGPLSDFDCACWRCLTHLGGASITIAIVLATVFFGEALVREAGLQAAVTLAATHLVAQVLKRTITRPRPSGQSFAALVAAPDRYSFPSGHAIAAGSVAFVYAWQFPALAPLLLIGAMLVGASRVRLGVHYPGDVLVGQVIALGGAMAVLSAW